MKIAVAGSIAMDQLMTFDGYFGELFREALPQVFVSFLADELVIRHSPGICRWSGPASWARWLPAFAWSESAPGSTRSTRPCFSIARVGVWRVAGRTGPALLGPRASSWAVVVDQPDLIVVMASDGRGSVWPQPRLPPGWPDGARRNRAGADDAAVPVATDAGLSVLPRSSIGRRHRPGT